MFKKTFWLLILIALAACGCGGKIKNNLYDKIVERDKLIVGVSFDSKPFSFMDEKGEIRGMEADLAREIAKRILGNKDKVIFKDLTPQDRMKAVMAGDVDMVISTMTITPQRSRMISFSSPYYVAGQAICVKKDSDIDSHYDLINKRIIVILGTTGEKNIKKFAPNALFQGYSTNSEAIEAFKTGIDDAITTDDSLLQGLTTENKDYIILPERLTREPYGIAFEKSGKTKDFQEAVNEFIKEMKFDGTLKNLKDKWGIT